MKKLNPKSSLSSKINTLDQFEDEFDEILYNTESILESAEHLKLSQVQSMEVACFYDKFLTLKKKMHELAKTS